MRPWCENSAGLVRSLLPRIEQFGIATAQEVQIETLADRLDRDTLRGGCSDHLCADRRGVDRQRVKLSSRLHLRDGRHHPKAT